MSAAAMYKSAEIEKALSAAILAFPNLTVEIRIIEVT